MEKKKITQNYVNTFSIVGFDPDTEELGVAVASKFLAAGAVVPYAKAGVGAVATQSWANPLYGSRGLELMAEGKSAEEALEILTREDENPHVRQAGFVDANGNSATYSGSECHDWAGGITGRHFACQGNILTGEEVVQAMAEVFQNTKGDLATRLTRALKAGEDEGGDSRGKQSASLLVVKEKGGYNGANDRYIDLRVDDHAEPVKELERILELHKLYFTRTVQEDILKVEGDLKRKLASSLKALDFIKTEECSDEDLFEALLSFQLIENFDERVQEKGFVDRKVVNYMESLLAREG